MMTDVENIDLSWELRDQLSRVRLVVFDFDGVFTDNTVYVAEDGSESVRCFRSDGIGLQRLRDAGLHLLILSTEANPVVAARAKKLGIPCRQGAANKRNALGDLALELGVDLHEVAYVGNDVNDLTSLRDVAVPIAVRDAHPAIIPHCRYQTAAFGGAGAVREVCDLIARARGDSG